jgi:hypothetical protein
MLKAIQRFQKALFLAVDFPAGLIHDTKRDERIRLKDVGHYSENEPFGRSCRGEINADIDRDAYKGRTFGIRQINAGSLGAVSIRLKRGILMFRPALGF